MAIPPDTRVIHTTPDYGVFFSQPSIKLVLTFHNYVLDPFMRAYSSPLQRLHYLTDLKLWTRLGISKAHPLTAVSQFTAELIRTHLQPYQPIHVIYNGIDPERFHPKARTNLPHKKLRVLFSGNLSRRKGSQWLVPISQRLTDCVELFYTSGLRPKKYRLSTENLTCLGAIAYEKMPALLQDMDVLLFPTVREGFSMAVLEAMASGLPVVASNCSSLPEQIDHGKGGYLCPVGDYRAFAKYIRRLATDRCLRISMGEYNRARIEKQFTAERMVRSYINLFERLNYHYR
jgi:glycosyltransferase involved in cell wall biosynthesis